MKAFSSTNITILKRKQGYCSATTIIKSFSSTNGPVRTAKQTLSGPQALSLPYVGCHLYLWAPWQIFYRLTGSTGSSSGASRRWRQGAGLQGLNVRQRIGPEQISRFDLGHEYWTTANSRKTKFSGLKALSQKALCGNLLVKSVRFI